MKTNVMHHGLWLSIVASLLVAACNPSREGAVDAQDSTSLTTLSGFGNPALKIPDTLHRSIITVTRHYTGALNNKHTVGMNLTFDHDRVYGVYRYATQKEFIKLKGSFAPDNTFKLEESVYTEKDGLQITGYFEGARTGHELKGTWFNKNRTKSFPFLLTEDAQPYPGWTFADNSKKDRDRGFHVMSTLYIWNAQGQLHQTLEDFLCTSDIGDANELELEDLNFDGHLDIRVLEASGFVNASYYYWLYDPQQNSFVENKELQDITSPEVDILTKEIISHWRSGAALYGTDYYTYSKGHFSLRTREEKNYAEEEGEGEEGPFTDDGGVEYSEEVNVRVCTLESAETGDCTHVIFSCGNFGVAERQLRAEENDLWLQLMIEEDDGTITVNPEYAGKEFEITYKAIEGWPCQPGYPDTKEMIRGTVPLILGFRLVE